MTSFARKRPITLKDVALAANVSPMTVSNYINGRLGEMSGETQERVGKTIRRLNYRPSSSGRSLRVAERFSIGLLFIDDSPSYLTHPAHSHLLAGLSNCLGEHGYALSIQGARPSSLSDALVLKQSGTDGLCVVLSGSSAERRRTISTLSRAEQPLIVFHQKPLSSGDDACFVREDDFRGGFVLSEHLLERGCRKLLMLLPDASWPAMEERLRGARSAISKHPSGSEIAVAKCGDAGLAATQQALEDYFRRFGAPDGILAGHDQMGIAALKFAKLRGIKVPSELKITGFNAFEFWQYTDPILTTVRAPTYEVGWQGGAQLFHRLQSGSFASREIVLPVSLQVGGST